MTSRRGHPTLKGILFYFIFAVLRLPVALGLSLVVVSKGILLCGGWASLVAEDHL